MEGEHAITHHPPEKCRKQRGPHLSHSLSPSVTLGCLYLFHKRFLSTYYAPGVVSPWLPAVGGDGMQLGVGPGWQGRPEGGSGGGAGGGGPMVSLGAIPAEVPRSQYARQLGAARGP